MHECTLTMYTVTGISRIHISDTHIWSYGYINLASSLAPSANKTMLTKIYCYMASLCHIVLTMIQKNVQPHYVNMVRTLLILRSLLTYNPYVFCITEYQATYFPVQSQLRNGFTYMPIYACLFAADPTHYIWQCIIFICRIHVTNNLRTICVTLVAVMCFVWLSRRLCGCFHEWEWARGNLIDI